MRLSTVILPVYRWPEARQLWQRAEDLGFHTAYTYDHLSWRSFRDRTWFGAVPTLTAAATATSRIRLGTMVTSPNFRHPVTLAKELVTLDDVSEGRITAGIGAGGSGFDATALGQEAWTPRQRADRFGEFLPLLDELLSQDVTTRRGTYYSAEEARNIPGCVQRPRLPLYVAATGPRGLRLAAEHGQGWISYGDPKGAGSMPPALCPDVIAAQLGRLEQACAERDRDPAELAKVLLSGSTQEKPLASVDAFVDYAGRYAELGITEIVLHWPVPDSVFEADLSVFEKIATDGPAQLR
ncbi:LLM class flavin-dependent oxidoreductase [Phaeacidiphilus oryzae]|uniref:LLM class flavin-dependent oxidoreductase n=1 Tax=Phaeacidiphilus oryzae TaxID=348818 RepID=UPI000565F38F|nr:LLM class flavin-dependent oxidoreductase [Phaeacidiphilus oryzae]